MSTRKLFYIYDANSITNTLPISKTHFVTTIWRPSLISFKPSGFALFPFFVWWLFHHLRIFSNREYCLIVTYHVDKIVHRSCVFPRYFRFPFMEKRDLQIGDIWTDVRFRGKGIATRTLSTIVNMQTLVARRLWYLVDEDNLPSIRVAENVGFRLFGIGSRTRRFGVRLFGAFRMETFDKNVGL